VDKEKLREYILYLRTHPEEYVKMWTGQELKPWQKLWLRIMIKANNLRYKYYIKTRFMDDVYYFPIRGLIKDKERKYISFYCCGCLDIHDDYPIKDVKYNGTRLQAIKEVFEEIESCMEGMNYCPKCNIAMENDDFYYDEEREDYIDIWICPQCGYREDIPE